MTTVESLISVNYDTDRPTVSARELHGLLEVATPFDKWFPRMCEYGFTDGVDFSTFLSESTGGRPAQDAQLTVEMGKEIAMLQRSEKGKQARTYFIELEKAWNSPQQVMARAIKIAQKELDAVRHGNYLLQAQIKQDAPKVLFANAVTTSHTNILIGELAKTIKQNGVDIGEKRLFEWLREKGYLIKRLGTDYNAPTQRSMELGLFRVKETAITHADGHVTVNKTTKVTGKGQEYFTNKFLN